MREEVRVVEKFRLSFPWWVWVGFAMLGGLWGVGNAWLVRAVALEAPRAPPSQAPAVTTWVDASRGVTCWLATSPHGVGISCLRDGPGEFGP